MKKKFIFGLGPSALLLGGCVVQSIHPLFNEQDYVAYPLAGTWTQKDGDKEQGVWIFAAANKVYKLTHTDEKGRKAVFAVAAGKIGTNVFLDFSPALDSLDQVPGSEVNDFFAADIIPAHVFTKVVASNGAISLVAMDYEWLQQFLEKNPKAIAHVVQDKRPILTASTEELQKFVAKYASDEKVFKNDILLVPKKMTP
jgi:hypothetical protein